MPLSNAGVCLAKLLTEPGDQAVSTWLSGALAGWVNFPTRGESIFPATDGSEGQSPFRMKGVSASIPYGLKGKRMNWGRPSAWRPWRSAALAGESLYPGPNAG